MKPFKTVIAPKGCCNYLTEGKEYEATIVNSEYFTIVDDLKRKILCKLRPCGHLNGLAWIIKPEQNIINQEIQLFESLMSKFFAKINDDIVNDTIHIDYVHEAIAEFIDQEIINKQL